MGEAAKAGCLQPATAQTRRRWHRRIRGRRAVPIIRLNVTGCATRPEVSVIRKDKARQARRLLADAELNGHKYVIAAVFAVIARR